MDLIELRDKARAVAFLVDGLWLQRLHANPATNVAAALELALEVASSGQPLLPLGFLADFRTIALGSERIQINREHPTLPEWPATLIQKYDDHVLGKLAADWTMERACDALRGYEGRDRVKGVAFLLKQFRERAHIGGIELSPAILRELVNTNAKELMQQSYERVETQGFPNDILRWYEAMIDGTRRLVEAFGPEDIVALETRTALAEMGEFVAMQQIVRASKLFREALPIRPVRALEGRKEIPSRILDEDQYPVGGYSSISNRGSMESLLHSQLAYMETDEEAQPDLFDIKYVRDELYYYSRDENQFRRKRRSFVIVLEPSLIGSRFKDTDLPYQRIIMVQSFVIAVVQKLEEWLSSDAIHFDILLPRDREFAPLTEEAKLFELLLGDLRSTGILKVTLIGTPTPTDNPKKSTVQKPDAQKNREAVTAHCKQLARLAQVYLLVVGVEPNFPEIDDVVSSTLTINGPRPTLTDGHGQPVPIFADDVTEHWFEAANNLLRLWV